uniref:Putative ovule protein n=1 Tax=Solanum chacoense TaxID=4108 RepID=A0A0V0HM99_SOLCH
MILFYLFHNVLCKMNNTLFCLFYKLGQVNYRFWSIWADSIKLNLLRNFMERCKLSTIVFVK